MVFDLHFILTAGCVSFFHHLKLQWFIVIINIFYSSQQVIHQLFAIASHDTNVITRIILNFLLQFIFLFKLAKWIKMHIK